MFTVFDWVKAYFQKQPPPQPRMFSLGTRLFQKSKKVMCMKKSISWPSFITKWFTIQKTYSKMHSTLRAEVHSEPYQTSKMDCLAKIVNELKCSILDVWQGSEYTSVVAIIIIISQLSKLLKWFKILKIEYLKCRVWLFHEIKRFINCGSKTAFLEVIIF